jgi:hypothetical protein
MSGEVRYDAESMFDGLSDRAGDYKAPGALFTRRTRKRLIIAWAAMAIAALCVVFL